MTDIMIGVAATIAFYSLGWNWGALFMGVTTVLNMWLAHMVYIQEEDK